MEYAETVAHLGKRNLVSSPPQSSASRERFKVLLQGYGNKAGGGRRNPLQQLRSMNSSIFQSKRTPANEGIGKKVASNGETPAEILMRLGRTLIARKEVFTKDEAALFIRGDSMLGRMGLIQLAGVEDRALASAALILLDELLLDDDVDHPSREAFTEAFVSVGYNALARELCLDTHILNDDTRHAAFRIALVVGTGHTDDLPLLFRNQRAALDLYLRWMDDMNNPDNEDDDDSVNTGSALGEGEDDRQAQKVSNKNPFEKDDAGPKTWEQIAQSVEEDDDFADFDNTQGGKFRALMQFSDSASNVSDDVDSSVWQRVDYANASEDSDPLRIKAAKGSSASFAQRTFPRQATANPEALLERLYPDASRADFANGLSHLQRELMAKDALQQKLVHDRLIELVRVRQTVDVLSTSTQKGSVLSGKAAQSLRAAKAVSDMSLANLLAREEVITQTKRAIEIVTERPVNTFVLNFSSELDLMVGQSKWEESVELIRRYVEERKELRHDQVEGPVVLPVLFLKARRANDAAISKCVKQIEANLDAAPNREVIRAFRDLHELIPELFRPINPSKKGLVDEAETFVRDTDLVLTFIAAEKAEKACVAMNSRYEQSALDLAEKSSRTKAALMDLAVGIRIDLEPDAVPANTHGRAKAVRAASDKYAASALAVAKHINKACADYLQWTEAFDVFGIDLERSRGIVVERCVELLQAIVLDAAPPGIPGETAVLLAVAKIGESMWVNAGLSVQPTSSTSRTTASASDSSSQSGSQTSSQYKSFVLQTNQGVLSASSPGVLDFYAELNNLTTSTHVGFAQLARRCTEATLDYVLDEMIATLDLLSKNIPQISMDRMIPNVEWIIGDVNKDDDGKRFTVPLVRSAWDVIDSKLTQVITPLLESCSSRAQAIQDALQTNERLTKAARNVGTILGRCAEQYRVRGNDVSGKGFLVLARDCQILPRLVLKRLNQCDTLEIQAQFDRLEPALATQFLRASAQHVGDKVMDVLSGAKDPLTGVRFSSAGRAEFSDSLTEDVTRASVGERWITIVHLVAEAVGECEQFLGYRYAAKLRSGLARHLGSRVQAFVESELASLGTSKLNHLLASLIFVERILKASGDEFGFSKAIALLTSKTDTKIDVIAAEVSKTLVKYSWLAECFDRL